MGGRVGRGKGALRPPCAGRAPARGASARRNEGLGLAISLASPRQGSGTRSGSPDASFPSPRILSDFPALLRARERKPFLSPDVLRPLGVGDGPDRFVRFGAMGRGSLWIPDNVFFLDPRHRYGSRAAEGSGRARPQDSGSCRGTQGGPDPRQTAGDFGASAGDGRRSPKAGQEKGRRSCETAVRRTPGKPLAGFAGTS